ncbi:MAG TPA: cation-translocating P-type ATPase [Anaerolineales bacterium]|nr:cation-translocating P-type ATPase [Anaerolineales bacterium]
MNWHSLSPSESLEHLTVNSQTGLSSAEVQQRLEKYGRNELTEKLPTPFWRLVLDQFKDFVVILLIVASVISILLGEYIDAGAILAIVLLNAIIGVVQESRAEQALSALKKMAAPEAWVMRDGERVHVSSRELVPGDIVFLEAGNYVPADLRLLEGVNLKVDEAALTGESEAVRKSAEDVYVQDAPIADRRNLAYMSTMITAGRGQAVVIGTGMQTQIGQIAELLQEVEEGETPLQKRLEELGRTLSLAALGVVVVVFLVALVNQTNLGLIGSAGLFAYLSQSSHQITEVFLTAVSLAIAAVPEGLPAVVTITLALGMREMVRRHALIRKLASVETLGSASVICSDKTGTLTQNAMTAVQYWFDGKGYDISGDGQKALGHFIQRDTQAVVNPAEAHALQAGLLAGLLVNDAVLQGTAEDPKLVGDPTETALVLAAGKADLWREPAELALPRIAENSFDSHRKLMSTVHRLAHNGTPAVRLLAQESGYVACVKGAPDVVLAHCTHYLGHDGEIHTLDEERATIRQANAHMANKALRVLAIAFHPLDRLPSEITPAEIERELVFLGLVGIIDPPRPEVSSAIALARQAGIRTVMITGDYPNTAKAIAEQIGLVNEAAGVVSGQQIEQMSDDALRETVKHTQVFARVSPHHKMRLVSAFQENGHVAAMTGDGVNDAPALKRADIGVAMGITGTDVAKEAAEMVLTDDNFASIVSAVEQGRIIYANIRKFVFFLLSSNVAEILIIFLATLAGLPSPLAAIQLLWLNLITDGAPALALAMEKGDPDSMQQPPRAKDEPIINGTMRLGIIVQTFAQTLATLGAYLAGLFWFTAGGPTTWGELFSMDWQAVDVSTAQTMAFVALSLCELIRAYTVRSERASVFTLGVFSNRWMQPAVGMSLLLLLLVVNIPFLQPVFSTTFIPTQGWLVLLGLVFLPAITEELTKWGLRQQKSA